MGTFVNMQHHMNQLYSRRLIYFCAQKPRKQSFLSCIKSLVHASQCRDENCRLPCQTMKKMVQHAKTCKRKTSGIFKCFICKQLISLCCYHAKHCQKSKCPVPFCTSIKNKRKKIQKRRKQVQLLRHRTNQMLSNADVPLPETQVQEGTRQQSIERCVQTLVHACQCRYANCLLPLCQKTKKVIQHTKTCERKTNGGCNICKQILGLFIYHAKHCQEAKCAAPFCSSVKLKLKQQELQRRNQ